MVRSHQPSIDTDMPSMMDPIASIMVEPLVLVAGLGLSLLGTHYMAATDWGPRVHNTSANSLMPQ